MRSVFYPLQAVSHFSALDSMTLSRTGTKTNIGFSSSELEDGKSNAFVTLARPGIKIVTGTSVADKATVDFS